MQYFGVPRCPYCKKRVNLIRTWSLKRQGEYQCPRCGGISNIFLSPLVYVLALLAVFSGAAVYFFHKFILDDVDLGTALQVVIPFAVFFLLSLFIVYLAKPVIKKVSREENGKKRKARPTAEERRASLSSNTGRVFTDQGDYLPPVDYRTGPLPKAPAQEPPQAAQQASAQGAARSAAPVQEAPTRARVSSVQEAPRPAAPRRAPVPQEAPQRRPEPQAAPAQPVTPREPAPAAKAPAARRSTHTVRSVEIPDLSDDFFKKYDDPTYVERRLKELEGKGE